MSRKCFSCGKTSKSGNKVSHSKRHTKRMWLPNLQSVNILVFNKKKQKDEKKKQYVCTKCLKANKVRKAV